MSYRSNRPEVQIRLHAAERAVLDAVLSEITSKAKDNVVSMHAVRTGRLLNSVHSVTHGDDKGEVVADVPYAANVHDGNAHMAPRPFLSDAATDVLLSSLPTVRGLL